MCKVPDCPFCSENFKRLYECAKNFVKNINTENNPLKTQNLFIKLKDSYYNYPHPYTIDNLPARLELRHSIGDLIRAAHYGKLHRYHLAILETAINDTSLLIEEHNISL